MRSSRLAAVAVALLLAAGVAGAQTPQEGVNLAYLRLNSLVRITAGAGAPSGGANGDVYVRTDGTLWTRVAGSWVQVDNYWNRNTTTLVPKTSGDEISGKYITANDTYGWVMGAKANVPRVQLDSGGSGSFSFLTSANAYGKITAATLGLGVANPTIPIQLALAATGSDTNVALFGNPYSASNVWTGLSVKFGYSSADNYSSDVTGYSNANASYGSRLRLRTHSGTNGVFNSGWWINESGHFYPETNWTLDVGLDATRVRTLYAAELNVWQLVAKTVLASIGGEIWTSETTKLTAALAAAATSITVNDNNLANGDRILLKSLTNVEWIAVTSAAGGSAGAYTYSVTRNLDGSGANDWPAGSAVVNTGTTGDGFMTQYSDTSGLQSAVTAWGSAGTLAGPTILGIVRESTGWHNIAPRWAVGRLTGLYDNSTNVRWGVAAGKYTGTWFQVDDVNGFRIKYGSTSKVAIDASGNASFSGDVTASNLYAAAGYFGDSSNDVSIDASGLTVGNTGRIQGGASAYGTGTGFWLGYDSAYKFRVGNPSGQRMFWDGTNFGFYGAHGSYTASGGLSFDYASPDTTANSVNWTSGAMVGADSNVLWLHAPDGSYVNVYNGPQINLGKGGVGDLFRVGASYNNSQSLLPWTADTYHLGASDARWNTVYGNTLNVNTGITANGNAGITNAGYSCGGTVNLSYQYGVIYNAGCVDPAPDTPIGQLRGQVAALQSETAALRAELAELRAALAAVVVK